MKTDAAGAYLVSGGASVAILLIPVGTTCVMFVWKWLVGLNATDNGVGSRIWLRIMLVVTSLLGVISTSALTGQAPDANMVADLLRTLGETIVAAYLSHAIYNSAFRKPAIG